MCRFLSARRLTIRPLVLSPAVLLPCSPHPFPFPLFRQQVLQDSTAEILFTLGQLSREFPEVAPVVTQELKRAGLVVPHHPPLRPNTTRCT